MTGIAYTQATLPQWQALLDAHRSVFESLSPGAAIGLLPTGNGRARMAQLVGEMIVFSIEGSGPRAAFRPINGVRSASVDMLFVLSDDALGDLINPEADDPFRTLSQNVGRGAALIYYLKARTDLEVLGYEDLFDVIGLSFAGACR